MSIIAEIDKMEEAVSDALDAALADAARAGQAFEDAWVRAVLAALDGVSLEDLGEVDLAALIEDALSATAPALTEAQQTITSERVAQMIEAAETFYEARGIDTPPVREAVRRSEEARQLTELFDTEMQIRDTRLKNETIRAVQDAIAEGRVSREELTTRIAERAATTKHYATTQVHTSISAYNQTYRNTLAQQAKLEHFLYYGGIKDTTRPFCLECAGKVFTSEQLDQMDNGMLNPVRVFKGGYNCRHSLVPADPSWSDDLSSNLVDQTQPSTVSLGESERSIKVFTG